MKIIFAVYVYSVQIKKNVFKAYTKNKNGVPKFIATDGGSEFIYQIMEQVCSLIQIKKLTSTAYHSINQSVR